MICGAKGAVAVAMQGFRRDDRFPGRFQAGSAGALQAFGQRVFCVVQFHGFHHGGGLGRGVGQPLAVTDLEGPGVGTYGTVGGHPQGVEAGDCRGPGDAAGKKVRSNPGEGFSGEQIL